MYPTLLKKRSINPFSCPKPLSQWKIRLIFSRKKIVGSKFFRFWCFDTVKISFHILFFKAIPFCSYEACQRFQCIVSWSNLGLCRISIVLFTCRREEPVITALDCHAVALGFEFRFIHGHFS